MYLKPLPLLYALCALTFTPTHALAESKLRIKPFIDAVSGPYLGFGDDEVVRESEAGENPADSADDDIRTTGYESAALRTHAKLGLKGTFPLDNGMVLKFKSEWDADLVLDEFNLELVGDFGRILVGADDNVAFELHQGVQPFTPGGGATLIDSPDFYPAPRKSAPFSTLIEGDDSNVLAYYSPDLNGLVLGVSYIFNNDQTGEDGRSTLAANRCDLTNGSDTTNLACADEEVESLWAVAGQYKYKTPALGAFSFSAGYSGGDNDQTALSLGARYQRDKIRLSAAFAMLEDFKGCAGECTVFSLGGAYQLDEKTLLGAAVRFSENEAQGENMAVQVGGTYRLGEYVSTGLDMQFISDESTDPNLDDINRFALGVLLAVKY